MAFEKTMMGNPSGDNPEKPINPKERIGFGIKYPSKVEAQKMTPEEQAARAKQSLEDEARYMQSVREKIGPMNDTPAKTDIGARRRTDVIMGMKAPTQEEMAAYLESKKEAEEMEKKIKKGGFLSRLGNF